MIFWPHSKRQNKCSWSSMKLQLFCGFTLDFISIVRPINEQQWRSDFLLSTPLNFSRYLCSSRKKFTIEIKCANYLTVFCASSIAPFSNLKLIASFRKSQIFTSKLLKVFQVFFFRLWWEIYDVIVVNMPSANQEKDIKIQLEACTIRASHFVCVCMYVRWKFQNAT